MTTTLASSDAALATERDEVLRLAEQVWESLREGEPAVALLGTDRAMLADVCDHAAAWMAEAGVSCVRLFAAGSGGSRLAERAPETPRIVYMAEGVENWPEPAFALLNEAVTRPDPDQSQRQILFVGDPAFGTRLFAGEIPFLTDQVTTVLRLPERELRSTTTDPVPNFVPAPAPSPRRDPTQARRGGRYRSMLALATVVLVVTAAAVATRGGLRPSATVPPAATRDPVQTASVPHTAPAPIVLPDPQATATPGAGRPAPAELARLRADFATFLEQIGNGRAPMTDAERAEMFDRFVQWRYGRSASAAPQMPPRN
ncbi:MAG: hypothetical protein JOY70_11525 [Acidisphaera sp.]|nr:hypothetical protein [Acidisphaera sp.]